MIQIDDSGWGSLLGGAMIGIHNTETNKFKAKIIPITYFQGSKFSKGEYRDYAAEIVHSCWTPMGMHVANEFQVCRGTLLDAIYYQLKAEWPKTKINRVEIGDPLQTWLEGKFADSLEKVGVPRKSGGAHCLSFNEQLDWIKADPKRVKHVKTGWGAWQVKYKRECLNGKK